MKLACRPITSATIITLLLASCVLQPPATVTFGVSNSSVQDQAPSTLPCTTAAGKLALDDIIVPIEGVTRESNRGEELLLPETSPIGTPITVEGWCYGEDGTELGYVRVTREYKSLEFPSIYIYAPRENPPPAASATARCVPPTEARGLEFCVSSSMFN